MSMHIQVEFPRPLDAEAKLRVRLAVAALAKSKRVDFARDGRGVLITGEAMSVERVRAALEEMDLKPESLHSSLTEEEDETSDDVGAGTGRERVRPIGR